MHSEVIENLHNKTHATEVGFSSPPPPSFSSSLLLLVCVCAVVLKFHLVEAFITFYSMVHQSMPRPRLPPPQWNVLALETTPARGACQGCGWEGVGGVKWQLLRCRQSNWAVQKGEGRGNCCCLLCSRSPSRCCCCCCPALPFEIFMHAN